MSVVQARPVVISSISKYRQQMLTFVLIDWLPNTVTYDVIMWSEDDIVINIPPEGSDPT